MKCLKRIKLALWLAVAGVGLNGAVLSEAGAATLYACLTNQTQRTLYPYLESQDYSETITLRPAEFRVIKFDVDRHYGPEEPRRRLVIHLGRPIVATWQHYVGGAASLPDGAACEYGYRRIRQAGEGYRIVWGGGVYH